MSFYDIISPFVDHDIVVDNAKCFHPSLDCISSNQTTTDSSMPPLEKYRSSRNSRRKQRKSSKSQQKPKTQQHQQSFRQSSSSSSSLSSLSSSSHTVTIKQSKMKAYKTKSTLLIPSKNFHDDNEISKQRNDDRAPMAPIRKQSDYYVTSEMTTTTTDSQQQYYQMQMPSSPISKSTTSTTMTKGFMSPSHNNTIHPLPVKSNSPIARVA